MIVWASLLLLAGGALGAFLLRRSWQQRDGSAPGMIAGGWFVLLGLVLASVFLIGPVKGTALALVMEGIGALLVIWQGRVRRKAARLRDAEAAPEPLEEPGRFWRGVLRTLLAGPLGMTAAMGVAFCVTVYLPGDPRTRIVLGGLLMPVLWGLAMTWTLADRRLLRATAVLVGASVIGFGLAHLGASA
ncbi:hypothetical protein [Novosphingobium sp. TCA1]|uniref:hypothetical protein n=1 Tax=Novosphingobium sp. TCA1 TaxID=2682474 RepID=UPI001308CCE3|nr:hypothetical protein [Novosphingobium sp. TCA1]GFE76278.1 hypothetical protein NTCA1_39270 [Novosphingobium sp. TCA1]